MKIKNLYEQAYRAYSNISFDPEKRAERIVIEQENELTNDLATMPEQEQETYIKCYTSHLFNWLNAMSRCYSVMITGGANFNNRRHDAANNAEHARLTEFIEWREKALKAIAKRIENAKPADQKTSERWEKLKKELTKKIEWHSVPNCSSMIERLAWNGEVELVSNCLELIKELQSTGIKFITPKHKIWSFLDVAIKAREAKEVHKTNTEIEVNGIKIVTNYEADRIQLFFNGKPEPSVISKLKHAAFKWSPTNGCWQRQLTNNAIYATKRLLIELK
jgi:hypothetical protein